jgi:hypothetical protein
MPYQLVLLLNTCDISANTRMDTFIGASPGGISRWPWLANRNETNKTEHRSLGDLQELSWRVEAALEYSCGRAGGWKRYCAGAVVTVGQHSYRLYAALLC